MLDRFTLVLWKISTEKDVWQSSTIMWHPAAAAFQSAKPGFFHGRFRQARQVSWTPLSQVKERKCCKNSNFDLHINKLEVIGLFLYFRRNLVLSLFHLVSSLFQGRIIKYRAFLLNRLLNPKCLNSQNLCKALDESWAKHFKISLVIISAWARGNARIKLSFN